MAYPSVYSSAEAAALVARIEHLTPASQPRWGKMNVAQMLAHCCVPYEMALTEQHARPPALKRWLMRALVKWIVVGPRPFPKNSPAPKEFKVAEQQDFKKEQLRLVEGVRQVQQLGPEAFEGRDHPSFGPLSAGQWSNLMYKHLDHHLRQFGV